MDGVGVSDTDELEVGVEEVSFNGNKG